MGPGRARGKAGTLRGRGGQCSVGGSVIQVWRPQIIVHLEAPFVFLYKHEYFWISKPLSSNGEGHVTEEKLERREVGITRAR